MFFFLIILFGEFFFCFDFLYNLLKIKCFSVVNIEETEAKNAIEEEGHEAKTVVLDTAKEKDQEVETGIYFLDYDFF